MADVRDEDLSDVTAAEMIAEVKRELALRERVYPNLVRQRRMHQHEADRGMRRMRAVLKRLLEAPP